MKHTSFSILLVLGSLALSACAGQTLEGGSDHGGSNGSNDPNGSNGSTSSGGSGTGDAIPDKPLDGTIADKPFVPKTIEIQYSSANAQWFLYARSYESTCGTMKERPDPSTSMVLTVGQLAAKPGTDTIAYGDGHAATLQLGVYDTSDKADARAVKSGVLRLDAWSDKPGDTVTGALHLEADGSDVGGTFTAVVCPAR